MLFVYCVALWLLSAGPYSCLTFLLSSCVQWILSNIVISLFGKRGLVALFFFGVCLVYRLSWLICSTS